MRLTVLVLAGLAVAVSSATAQTERVVRPEIRPFAGVFLPTGDQRSDFRRAPMVGVEAALELSQRLHLVGSLGWTNGRDRFAQYSNEGAFIWAYDVGVELNLRHELGGGWLLRPFVGTGAGGRTYKYKENGVNSNTCSAGYGAVGSELQKGSVAFRFESRDYLTCFESPTRGIKTTRNDVGLSLGLAYHLR